MQATCDCLIDSGVPNVVVSFFACNDVKDVHDHDHDHEMITTLGLFFSSEGGDVLEYQFVDM